MLTDGDEKRQFLHTEDCGRCLSTLATKYDEIPDNEPLDVTIFKWNTIKDIANIVADNIPGTVVTPGERQDMTQGDKQNQPDEAILKYWQPTISLEDGIKGLIDEYSKGN